MSVFGVLFVAFLFFVCVCVLGVVLIIRVVFVVSFLWRGGVFARAKEALVVYVCTFVRVVRVVCVFYFFCWGRVLKNVLCFCVYSSVLC